MSHERLLIRSLLELVDTMITDYDAVDFLYLLCDRTVEVLQVDAVGVLWLNSSGEPEVAAASTPQMRKLEQFQLDQRQGPGVEALELGAPVDDGDLDHGRGRWPDYAAEAIALGFHSVHAHPMCAPRSRTIGALDVVRGAVGGFSDDEVADVGGLADMAAIGIVHERALREAERQISNLRQAREKRSVVDQATAVLADRTGVDARLAFEHLRIYARSNNHELRDVAGRFLAGELDVAAVISPTT